jgi:hypothetical protein
MTVHIVLDQQDAHALGAQRPEQARQFALLQVTQAGGGLIQQQQLRISGERACDFDDALLAQRQTASAREEILAQTHAPDLLRRLRE